MSYNPQYTQEFYDAYGEHEWSRLDASAYGRLQAIIHTDFLKEHIKSGDKVLDVGCGPGRFSIQMVRLGARVTLLDISPQQLELARDNLTKESMLEAVEDLIQGDVADLSQFPDESFDTIVCYGGALSYACERRFQAAYELVRVTRPGGVILASVMSRYGAAANIVRRAEMSILKNPEEWELWGVIQDGELPGFPSRSVNMQHPAMHLYSSDELRELFEGCQVLGMAASNATSHEQSTALEEISLDSEAWDNAVELERRLGRVPGLLDSGGHIIIAVRKNE